MSVSDLRAAAAVEVKFKTNDWLIRRTLDGLTIVVVASRIPSLSTWGMICKVNGEIVDHRQADDVFETAQEVIEQQLQNIDLGDGS